MCPHASPLLEERPARSPTLHFAVPISGFGTCFPGNISQSPPSSASLQFGSFRSHRASRILERHIFPGNIGHLESHLRRRPRLPKRHMFPGNISRPRSDEMSHNPRCGDLRLRKPVASIRRKFPGNIAHMQVTSPTSICRMFPGNIRHVGRSGRRGVDCAGVARHSVAKMPDTTAGFGQSVGGMPGWRMPEGDPAGGVKRSRRGGGEAGGLRVS